MDCSYCKKKFKTLFLLQEDIPGEGPTRKQACFSCIQDLGEKAMQDLRGMKVDGQPQPGDL